MPPYLAGRKREQTTLRVLLEDLARGNAPGTQVILVGPRGNGKTVLLHWIREAAGAIPGVASRFLLPSDWTEVGHLRHVVPRQTWWRRLWGAPFSFRQPRRKSFPDALLRRATAGPLLFLVDEAHTMSVPVGRALLDAAQRAGRHAPFLAVLAGTPDLPARLRRMGASFWNPAMKLRLNRLTAEATTEAFRRPLVAGGFDVSPKALAAMVVESQRYPFFVQLLGREVWGQAQRSLPGDRRITRNVADAALPAFRRTRDAFYAERFEELDERRLAPVGSAVAEAFRSRTELGATRLREAIGHGLGAAAGSERVEEAFATLRDLGVIWRTETRPVWEPGIPSLMDYLRKHGASG